MNGHISRVTRLLDLLIYFVLYRTHRYRIPRYKTPRSETAYYETTADNTSNKKETKR